MTAEAVPGTSKVSTEAGTTPSSENMKMRSSRLKLPTSKSVAVSLKYLLSVCRFITSAWSDDTLQWLRVREREYQSNIGKTKELVRRNYIDLQISSSWAPVSGTSTGGVPPGQSCTQRSSRPWSATSTLTSPGHTSSG